MKYALVFILCALGIGVYLFFTRQDNNINNSGNLSARSKTFLEKRYKNTSLAGQEQVSTKEALLNEGEVYVDTCFSFQLPFKKTYVEHDGECFVRMGLRNPAGTIFAYKKKEAYQSVEDISEVLMRRKFPDMYSEEKKIINGKTFLIFTHSNNEMYGTETVVFYAGKDFTFTLSILGPGKDKAQAILDAVLSSVVFYN